MSDFTTHQSTKRNRIYVRQSLESRFWKYVKKTDSCWLWTGATREFGYGVINKGGNNGGTIVTHRLSWELHHGPIPEGLCVLHKCDVPACVNPEHLFLGTIADNNHDMQQKGRYDRTKRAKGENHGCSKLTKEKVIEIRQKYADFNPVLDDLAKEYGISLQQVFRIVHNQSWKHVGGPTSKIENLPIGETNNMARLTAEQVLAIRSEYEAGNTDREALGKKYSVSHVAIWRIVKRLTWKRI